MDVVISEKAQEKIKKKGGTIAIDFVPPVGCGKVSEVTTDLYLKGKNISVYTKHQDGEITVLLAPQLKKYVKEVHLVTSSGLFGSKVIARVAESYSSAC